MTAADAAEAMRLAMTQAGKVEIAESTRVAIATSFYFERGVANVDVANAECSTTGVECSATSF